jgi:hypothetical protein
MKFNLLFILLTFSLSAFSQQDTTKKNADYKHASEIAPPPPSAYCTSFPHLFKNGGRDILIWNGDTMKMFSKPFQHSKHYDSFIKKYFPNMVGKKNWGYSHDYVAEWLLIENELYLNNLYVFTTSFRCKKLDLSELFGENCKDGTVKADWISQVLNIIDGELIHFIETDVMSIYEKEFMLTFKLGVLTEIKEYDNTKSFKSFYTENRDSLNNFIYSSINWSLIPDLSEKGKRVLFTIHLGETPKIDSVRLVYNGDSVSNEIVQELIRVIKSIPHWNVYYKREVYNPFRISWTIPFYLDEETRKRYAR